ncbi:MAG: response regulator, partial [Halobacteriales archaeon]
MQRQITNTGSISILHVDDDPDFAELTATFLEREDDSITVDIVTSASDGLDRLETTKIDCIVSDYEMPGQNGIEFLQAVREEYPELPFILFTGKGSEEVASDAIAAGVNHYLQKGSGTDQFTLLVNKIKQAVERYRAQQTQERHLEAIETAQEGISILNEDGEFIYVNERYADLYGYEPEEMLGEHWELIYPDNEIAFARDEILPTVADEGYWHGESTGLRADGTTFPEDHVVSQTNQDDLVCTVRDLTSQQEQEAE